MLMTDHSFQLCVNTSPAYQQLALWQMTSWQTSKFAINIQAWHSFS